MNIPHKIIVIDPGETVGIVRLVVTDGEVALKGSLQEAFPFGDAVLCFRSLLTISHVDVVVVEDYRIYASHAGHHVGARLHTPELIGAFAALCELNLVPLVRLPANKKARWPLARLKSRFPQYAGVPTPHALDALKLGLAYLETGGIEFPRRTEDNDSHN